MRQKAFQSVPDKADELYHCVTINPPPSWQGIKEDPAKPKEVKLVGQAGWLKKSSGKFLGGYKDRYFQLDRTKIVVYDNEDLKNCVEHVDLENFDKCHELRSTFTKKHRLILMRAPKSGSKVCDVKLQAQNQEEKEAWIKALNDGINRAKNKIFDEVKVDEHSSLEHVTRTRPKGNRGRRPPTRIHMKDVANFSSDGILRLDLDATGSTPNGTQFQTADGNKQNSTTETQEAPGEAAGEDSAQPKKVLKPPMPPSMVTNVSESQESDTKPEELAPAKMILMPPMPPSKEQKPSENQEEQKPSEEVQEKKAVKLPMPPSKENKPSTCGNWEANGEKASDSKVESGAVNNPSKPSLDQEEPDNPEAHKSSPFNKTTHPPSPPSKDMKPKQALIIRDIEVIPEDIEVIPGNHEDADDKDKTDVKDNSAQCQEGAEEENTVKTVDIAFTLSNNVPKRQEVMWDSSNSALEEDPVEQNVDKPACPDTATVTVELAKPYIELKLTPSPTPESVQKSPGPPALPKKKPLKPPTKKEDSGPQIRPAVSISSSLPAVVSPSVERISENVPAVDIKPTTQEPKGEHKVVILSLSSAGVGEDSNRVCGTEVEEKSVDSGQLSAEESENSDQVTSSADKLQGSFQGLDGETSEDDLEPLDTNMHGMEDPPSANLSAPLRGTVETSVSSPLPAANPCAEIFVPNSPSKIQAASMGNLIEIKVLPQVSDMKDLQNKVSVELKETVKILGEIGNEEGVKDGTDAGILLSTAMEKLLKADQFLREAKSIKQLENKRNRTSW
ncbi:hypothetical protein P4O66_006837 [Electrophorus voltai]|uniref:PH domain-containing protein n=1 Tax=Electrophorus voltai TaxID=2609070 RepID=A0AAD8ZFI2_9TELE|nr:hypothetical protein P4O66_006837 [Electrophorus voltai]